MSVRNSHLLFQHFTSPRPSSLFTLPLSRTCILPQPTCATVSFNCRCWPPFYHLTLFFLPLFLFYGLLPLSTFTALHICCPITFSHTRLLPCPLSRYAISHHELKLRLVSIAQHPFCSLSQPLCRCFTSFIGVLILRSCTFATVIVPFFLIVGVCLPITL